MNLVPQENHKNLGKEIINSLQSLALGFSMGSPSNKLLKHYTSICCEVRVTFR